MNIPLYLAMILLSSVVSQAAFASSCAQGEATHIWIVPQVIEAGAPVKIMAVSTAEIVTELLLIDPQGKTQVLETTTDTDADGMPWRFSAQIGPLGSGHYQIEAKANGNSLACREIFNGDNTREKPVWNETYEAYYSAWIEQLFDGAADEDVSFPSLEPVLRDPEHNFLHNALGLNEDNGLVATPDCADFPYFLRSYFAWKNGLPFSYRFCNRGSAAKPPSCDSVVIRTDFVQKTVPLATFNAVSHSVMDAVQSGNGRTALASQETDFYPVPLKREALWPGTIYADPYGHVLILSKWVAQTPDSPGIIFAVDAQPDNSIGRKRFWEGSFLFANIASAGPGFKAFRPIANNRLLNNDELPNYSLEQANLSPDEFYTQMYKLINPKGLNAKQAYEATLTALVEQLETRVKSIENGEAYFRKGGGSIAMPNGAAIFETVGPWEDFATPSRDMRLIIAMNVLLKFPEKIQSYPELFNLNANSALKVKTEIELLHGQLTKEKKIQYIRSNGEPWELSVADVLARKSAFEMGYNPNDCVEVRWGAEAGTEEYASCRRNAPAAQIKQMTAAREWFREAKRPSR
jgi:hypothetical protein